MTDRPAEAWTGADAYERYVGRWSRLVAAEFVAWLGRPQGAAWLDVGCGTGALGETVLALAAPAALDREAAALDEGRRFPLCRSEALEALFRGAGLAGVASRAIDVPTRFRDFDDYWSPFLGGQGPAPAYTARLDEARRARLCERLRATLPTAADGAIDLVARAWAVRGVRPGA